MVNILSNFREIVSSASHIVVTPMSFFRSLRATMAAFFISTCQTLKGLPLIRYAGSAGRSLGRSAADRQQIRKHLKLTTPATQIGESRWGSYHGGGTFGHSIVSFSALVNIFLISICNKINKIREIIFLYLFKGSILRYTISNIAATPLNNAQPWRLFNACRLVVQ